MCNLFCRKLQRQDNTPPQPVRTVRQTMLTFQRSTPNRLYNPSETPIRRDNSLIFDRVLSRERYDIFQGYSFSSRSDLNQSVVDHVIPMDAAPSYESQRASEITSEPVNISVLKPNDNDGLPTYEEVVEMSHQSR